MRTNAQLHLADLAQLAEHLICNQRVSGSNPLIGMGLWRETAFMRYLSPQVHLVATYHPRCWEELLLRCSLVADAIGVNNGYSAITVSYIIFIVINYRFMIHLIVG